MSRFLEYGEHNGHMYGTSLDSVKDVLDSGKICVIDIEPHVSVISMFLFTVSLQTVMYIYIFQCIHSVRTKKLKPYIIFVRPPSPECMKQTRRDPNFVANSFIKRSFKVRWLFRIVNCCCCFYSMYTMRSAHYSVDFSYSAWRCRWHAKFYSEFYIPQHKKIHKPPLEQMNLSA